MKRITRALAIVVLSALATSVDATQVIYRTPSQMGSGATLVVQGTVSGVRSYWNEERSKIFTEATIAVDETHKGPRTGIVRVTQLGGVVGNVKMSVSGSLEWSDGEEVLLFLEPFDGERYQVFGFSQGKFEVQRHPETGEAFVRRSDVVGLEMVGSPAAPGGSVPTTPTRVKLSEFLSDALAGADRSTGN